MSYEIFKGGSLAVGIRRELRAEHRCAVASARWPVGANWAMRTVGGARVFYTAVTAVAVGRV